MGGVSHLFAPSGSLQELIADGSAFSYQPWSCTLANHLANKVVGKNRKLPQEKQFNTIA